MPWQHRVALMIASMWFTIMGVAPFAWPDHDAASFLSAFDLLVHFAGGYAMWRVARLP